MLEDDDESQPRSEHVPVLWTQPVRILLVVGTVPVTTVLAGRRRVYLVLFTAHVRRVMRRVELGQWTVNVARQVVRRRVDERVDAARYEVRRVRYHEGLRGRLIS